MENKKWTLQNIPDLSGKVVIVTGGNSGLGFESVKAFAEKGAEVILACRSIEKGENASLKIAQSKPKGKIVVMSLDLTDLASIKSFAADILKDYNQLDVLLNNAGIMMSPYGLTKDGFESQIGTNHLGHFALTGHLIKILISTPNSRIVNVSSNAHKFGKMDFDNLLFENGKGYTPMKAYGQSKLANLLFTYELQRRLEKSGASSLSVAAHPGIAATNLAKYMEDKWWFKLLMPLASLMVQNQADGALPQIRATVDPDVKGGQYYGPGGSGERSGPPVLVQSNEASHNKEDAKKLWELSEQLTGLHYL